MNLPSHPIDYALVDWFFIDSQIFFTEVLHQFDHMVDFCSRICPMKICFLRILSHYIRYYYFLSIAFLMDCGLA